MKNFIHLDFSNQGKCLDLMDITTGSAYLARRNVFREELGAEFDAEIMRKREDTKNLSDGIAHWLRRGWDAVIPLYLMSRHMKFVDTGSDRCEVLEKLFTTYVAEEGCPSLTHKDDLLEVPISLNGLRASAQWMEGYIDAIAKRETKRAFKSRVLKRNDALLIISDAVHRIVGTFQARDKSGAAEKYIKSYGCAFNIYAVIYSVEGLTPGIYEVNTEASTLGKYESGDFRRQMSNINWGMSSALTANYTVILCINPEIYSWRYRHDRAFRNLMIEAGRIMHEFIIAAGCRGVQGVVTPAIADSELSELLKIDSSKEMPFYTGTFGVFNREGADK